MRSDKNIQKLHFFEGDSKNVSLEEVIIDRGEAMVDNHFLRVNILTFTLTGMYYLFYHTGMIEFICRRRISHTKLELFWHNRTKYGNHGALFWCNTMMSYPTSMTTDCQTAKAALPFKMYVLI